MKKTTAAALFLLAASLPWAVMFATNALLSTPTDAWLVDACSRVCHSSGCAHSPVLPAALTADSGLFGQAIDQLYRIGRLTGRSSAEGYGAANLALFCVLWPALMLGMVGLGLRQRVHIAALRRAS